MERYKSSTFYYRSMKSFLEEMKKKNLHNNDDGKLVFLDPFIRTLKNKINKYKLLYQK